MVNVYSLDGKKKKTIELGRVFSYPLREDLIKRVVVAMQANRRQRYGTDKLAGMRTSAHYHGSSRVYPLARMAQREMARMARIHGGGPLQFVARVVPQARKGRKAHPPKPEKDFSKEVNKKEKKLALYSAISATANKELVAARGHKIEKIKEIPLVLEDKFEDIAKTKEVAEILKKFGLEDELKRAKKKKIRAGKGKMRGRKYKKKKSALIVVSRKCNLEKAARNLPGVEITLVKDLNVEKLAPGCKPGRLTIWSESAFEQINKI